MDNDSRLFTEKIELIGRTKKIFIVTNSNQQLGKGDFITLTFDNRSPVARALVAKNHEGKSGVKILKIYSLKRWMQLHKGRNIKIVKGDDSFLFAKKVEEKKEGPLLADDNIENPEDLYNDKFLEGDMAFLNNSKRLIKPDNVVGISWARPNFEDTKKDIVVGNEFGFQWSYQFQDNMWVEGEYSRVTLAKFPSQNLDSTRTSLAAKVKYTIEAPLNTYVLPYVGFRSNSMSVSDSKYTEEEDNKQIIEDLSKDNLIYGVTSLTRTVPGWFITVNLGSDKISVGTAVEF